MVTPRLLHLSYFGECCRCGERHPIFIRSRRFCTACLTAKVSPTPGFVCKLRSSRGGTEVSVCSKGFSKSRFTHLGNTVASVGSVPDSTCAFASASTCKAIVFCGVGSLWLLRVCVCVSSCVSLCISVLVCPVVRHSACAYRGLLACLQGLSVFQGFPVRPWGHRKQSVNTTAPRNVCQKDIRKTCNNNTRTAAHTCPHMTKNEKQPATTQTNT